MAVDRFAARRAIVASFCISEGDYVGRYWPQLEDAIGQLLNSPTATARVSFEQVYSCVYKCVCNQLSERLYADVTSFVRTHLQHVVDRIKEDREAEFVAAFNQVLCQYSHAVQQISRVFTYLNRCYIEPRLNTTLHEVLLIEFSKNVVDVFFSRLVGALTVAQANPFTVSPAVMASVVTELYALRTDYAVLAPELFAAYIPNVLAPMSIDDIPKHITEVHWIRERLTEEGYSRDCAPLKRPLDNDNSCSKDHR